MARVRITASSTVGTGSHALKDAVGGIFTFANAAAVSGGTFLLEQLVVHDIGQAMPDLDIVLFDRTIAGTVTDDSAFDPTDADILNIVGIVQVGGGHWCDFSDNSGASMDVNKAIKVDGTSLFAAIVARSVFSPATDYPSLSIVVNQD